jgi:hypothetical protein
MTKVEECAWLYDQEIYDDALTSGIIEDKLGTILANWKENPHLDIDTIAKKPVRFYLCASGFREWRDTMLWRRAYEEGVTYTTPDLITLSEMTSESLYDVFWHYVEMNEAFADTAWGYHFQQEMVLREKEYE